MLFGLQWKTSVFYLDCAPYFSLCEFCRSEHCFLCSCLSFSSLCSCLPFSFLSCSPLRVSLFFLREGSILMVGFGFPALEIRRPSLLLLLALDWICSSSSFAVADRSSARGAPGSTPLTGFLSAPSVFCRESEATFAYRILQWGIRCLLPNFCFPKAAFLSTFFCCRLSLCPILVFTSESHSGLPGGFFPS
jgi:hypothetical protein